MAEAAKKGVFADTLSWKPWLFSALAAIGRDYRLHPTRREAAMQAVETGISVLAGPLPFVQDGVGLIARDPIFFGHRRRRENRAASGGSCRRL